eukprot:3902171-Prorocentrum_lima.AAC.1
MTSSLVGSEMCIRDRHCLHRICACASDVAHPGMQRSTPAAAPATVSKPCLLYTSDAADDM